jgi:ribosomal protein S18 acetylase RimI-like enzyme
VNLPPLDARVHSAQGDAWQAEGRLRTSLGGGAMERPGIRLMASGLPHARWNNGDVTDASAVDWHQVRAWYAARAHGAGVPWGVRVAADAPFGHGRRVLRQRCMALLPADRRSATTTERISLRVASRADLDAVTRIDAEAFEAPADEVRPWIAPRLAADRCTVAIAELDGAPVGVATALNTNARAGPAIGIFGVGVVAAARRRGVATALTDWLLARGFAGGATLAHLNPDSEAAARLYRRLGFVETRGLDVYVDL